MPLVIHLGYVIHLIDISEENVLENYLKVRFELSKYDKRILKKKEVVIFNKTDLISEEVVEKKINTFKKKFKKKFETLSLLTSKNLEKVKKIIYKNVYK